MNSIPIASMSDLTHLPKQNKYNSIPDQRLWLHVPYLYPCNSLQKGPPFLCTPTRNNPNTEFLTTLLRTSSASLKQFFSSAIITLLEALNVWGEGAKKLLTTHLNIRRKERTGLVEGNVRDGMLRIGRKGILC
jgi:hypothetical protein